MGYTHYYYQKPELDQEFFKKIGSDFEKMIPVMEHLGIKLGDWGGDNKPIINQKDIAFNGLEKCGHEEHHIGLAWPSASAQGVKPDHTFMQLEQLSKGTWFAGRELETRVCGGDCSYETFAMTQQTPKEQEQNIKFGYIFNCTKTNYKPYDLAVQVCLIIAKHYLKDDVLISSDGENENWIEASQLVNHFLGYGENFRLDTKGPEDMPQPKQPEPEPVDMTKIEVGDIFERSWGYDQTNVNFVKVVEVTKTRKSARVVSIGSKIVENTSSMSGRVIADPENITNSEKRLLRVRKGSNMMYLGEYWKWDGKPCYTSSYA